MANQITRLSMAEGTRAPNLADIVKVEWRDDVSGELHVSAMTDVARSILQRTDVFYYVDAQGLRADVIAWTVYEHPFLQTKGGTPGFDGMLQLPRF